MPKVTGKKPVAQKPSENAREVVYPELGVSIAVGDAAITFESAKQLIGWEEVDTKDASCVAELSALTGKHVRLHNNTTNRYLTPQWLLTLKQEHLQRRWRVNGEAIVIGKTANVLSGQHRLLSFILACLEMEGGNREHWFKLWPDGNLKFETLVVTGVDEGDETFRTLNCGKPGTFAEVLFRSEHLAKYKSSQRKDIAKIADYAIRLLWQRTGENADAFHPRRTHSEAMDFIERHPRVLKAVKHIYDENQTGKDADGRALPPSIGQYLSPGYAAAILYLMAASGTPESVDYLSGDRSDKRLDMKRWQKAEEFWMCLSQGHNGEFGGVINALRVLDSTDGEAKGTLAEKIAVLCNAWAKFVESGKGPKEKDVALTDEHYEVDEDGNRHLVYAPTFGGIDLGGKVKKVVTENEDGETPDENGENETKKKEEMKTAQPPAKTNEVLKELAALRQKAKPGSIILMKSKTADSYFAYDADAEYCAALLKMKPEKVMGVDRVVIAGPKLDASIKTLNKAKHSVAVMIEKRTGPGKTDLDHEVTEHPAKKK